MLAERTANRAIKIMKAEGSLFEKARAQKFFGLTLINKGDKDAGTKLLKSSLATIKKIKMDYEANIIREVLSSRNI